MVLVVATARAVEPVADADDAEVGVEDLVVVVVLVRHRAEERRAVERHLVAAVVHEHVEDGDDGERVHERDVRAEAERAREEHADVEHALDPQYARRLGVNLDDLLVSQPSSGEEALQIVETLVRSNAIDVVVLDSVAALVTKQELSGEIGDSTVGTQARLMSAAMRKLTGFISKARTTCIFTNQIREKIGVMFGSPETTPGGRALKFFASIRVDIRRIGQIKATDGTVQGSRTKVKIVKNKVAPPFTDAEFDIMYNEGISSVGSLIDLAQEFEIIQKRGSWFSYDGSQLGQGRDATKTALKEDEALYAEIEEKVKAKMAG